MDNCAPGQGVWGLAEATRHLLDAADPAEIARRDRQVNRAIRSFLAQAAGTVVLDDALTDQLIILADHFGLDEGYFLDPKVASASEARMRNPAPSGSAATAAPPASDTADMPADARRPGRFGGVALVSVGVLAGAAVGGAVGYLAGASTDRAAPPGGTPTAAAAVDGPAPELRQAAKKDLASVVQLRVQAGKLTRTGSGIVLSPDGLLLTSDHVVAAAAHAGEITVLSHDGAACPAHVVGRNPAADIAVVAADGLTGLTPIELGAAKPVHVGEHVLAIGPPPNQDAPLTSGVVGGVVSRVVRGMAGATNRRALADHEQPRVSDAVHAIQIDAALSPGSAGGPLVDSRGAVIGVDTLAPNAPGPAVPDAVELGATTRLGLAVPIARAARIAEQLVDTSRSAGTLLGVSVSTAGRLAVLKEPPGARVVAVAPGSPADKAGLKIGDLVVDVDGRPVASGEEFVAATRAVPPNHAVTLQLIDGRSTHVLLGRRPTPAHRIRTGPPLQHR